MEAVRRLRPAAISLSPRTGVQRQILNQPSSREAPGRGKFIRIQSRAPLTFSVIGAYDGSASRPSATIPRWIRRGPSERRLPEVAQRAAAFNFNAGHPRNESPRYYSRWPRNRRRASRRDFAAGRRDRTA